MASVFPWFLILPAAGLFATALVPSAIAESRVNRLRRVVTGMAALQFCLAVATTIALVSGFLPVVDTKLFASTAIPVISLSIFYDGVASLMLPLVSFVGWVICRYSIRYLDGEKGQGRYYRWTGFTIGAVSLMVISGNLLMFVACWIATSLGLHQLLMHYGHRPAARRAAWTKFTISRVGDLALLGAIAILISEFGTLEFPQLFLAISTMSGVIPAELHVAGILLVAGAATKSAQFPLHTWLPQTMETPTPVSALMHAGIVNAGGYLIIRTSPILTLTPWSLSILAIIGAITACYAAVVMLTQTSIKKSLAYSTVAQMGFMMLQCGLGAFSAAMLHILAHSLYKAHAFLSSGGAVAQQAATEGVRPLGNAVGWVKILATGIVVFLCLSVSLTLVGSDPATKPGGLLLGGILSLALTHWIAQVMRTGNQALLVKSAVVSVALCFAYAINFTLVDRVISSSVPVIATSELGPVVALIVLVSFAGMLLLHSRLLDGSIPRWAVALYIHASNGFYLESGLRRLFGPLLSK